MPYRRICGDRKLSNRLTSASAPNTNKTYGGNLLLDYAMYFMPYIVDSVVRSSTTKTWRPEMSPRPTEHSRPPRCAPPCAPCAPPVAFGIRLEAQNLTSTPRKVLILQPNMFIERGDCVSLTAQCNTARGGGSNAYVDVQCLTGTWGESLGDDLCLHGLPACDKVDV